MGTDLALGSLVVVTDAGPLLHLHWVGASGWALPRHQFTSCGPSPPR
jgi:hypothetical protein